MKTLSVLIPFLLLGALSASCSAGCLKCSDKNICLYCDITNGYVSQGNGCVLNSIPNCVVANENNKCSLCEPSFYPDYHTGYCIQIASSNAIPKCLNYASLTTCQTCEPEYIPKNGKCVAVEPAKVI